MGPLPPWTYIVPVLQLVLINVSDHFTRVKANSADGASPVVYGCLLGAQSGRTVDVSNSFEIKYTTSPEGHVVIDEPFLAKKTEQCKPGASYPVVYLVTQPAGTPCVVQS